MARLKTLKPRIATKPLSRIKTSDPQPGESGWEARERLHGNRHQRGYGTAWDKLRIRILTRDKYLCQPCYQLGRPEPASQVDHIIPKAHGGTDDHSNLQSICTACHKVKTARESRAPR